jgi:hypothetical protein
MAGLVPAIHVFLASSKQDVDARAKRGHDAGDVARSSDSNKRCNIRSNTRRHRLGDANAINAC